MNTYETTWENAFPENINARNISVGNVLIKIILYGLIKHMIYQK